MVKNKCEECENEVSIEDEMYCNDCLESPICVRCDGGLSGFESVLCFNCSMHDEVNSDDYTSNEIEIHEAMGYSLEDIKRKLSEDAHINKDELNSYLLENGYKEPVKEVSLIFGASKGIGSAVMRDLHCNGELVVSVSRSVPELISDVLDSNKDIIELKEEDRDIYAYYYNDDLLQIHICGDLSEEKVIDDIEFTIKKYNLKIRNLISCHGISRSGGVEGETIVDFRDVMELNVNSNYNLILNLYPYMLDVINANIIIISSISSERAGSSISYSVSKAAVDMLVKSLALNLSKYGIRVNSINPGLVSTGFHLNNGILDSKEDYYNLLRSEAKTSYPLGRVGNVSDIVGLVNFLINAEWATGVNYILDGGRLLK